MKKFTICILTILVILLSACSQPAAQQPAAAPSDNTESAKEPVANPPADESKKDPKDISIGILVYSFANDYLSYVRQGMNEKAKELGVNIEIVDANNNQAKQNDQADMLITKGVDALIVALEETEAAQTMIDKCKDAGIPIILVNKKPTQEVLDSYDKCWYVGASTQQPGECQAELVIEDWKANPAMDKNKDGILQYVLLLGLKGHVNAEARVTGMNLVFDNNDFKREELDMQEGKWDTTKAKDLTDAWLMKYGDSIEAIISNNDAMALGAIEACKAQGYFGDDKTKVMPIYGINAIEAGVEALKNGELMGTVLSDMISEGKITVQVAYNVLNGKEAFDGITFDIQDKAVYIPGIPIRMDNIELAESMYK